jgi:serine/threonine protein kinase
MNDQTVLHYKIIEELGRGGMGVVYLAEDMKLKRKVAIKFLPRYIASDAEERQRFEIEAQAAASLNHPNITTIHAIEEEDDNVFIVMEYIDGIELKDKIKSGRIRFDEAINIAIQIAEGLEAAHKKGVVHRDIKSGNIMITKEGKAKIMDFGLAKIGKGSQVTKIGTTIGTISYMSPEQTHGDELDHRSDLWSFGVVLYEMLSNRLPFKGDYDQSIIYSILNEEPHSIRNFRADVPDYILSIIYKVLQKNPADRYQNASEIISDLRNLHKPENKKSIAVMYFENMSPDKESDYFCAGITEDIITDLSKVKELKIVPRTDVLIFRNKEINSARIGEALNVKHILEGSVRKSGNKMRITAQLINVQNGEHVWVERFDRNVNDIFDLQNEISQKIVQALKVSLTDSEKESLQVKPTDDLRAYDFYMRGREFINLRGRKNNEQAIQMFEKAISIDKNFASAYAGLAEAYSCMYEWYDGKTLWLEKIIDADQKALSLDSSSIEAKFGIAMVYFYQNRFDVSKRELEAIIKEDPKYYPAFLRLAMILELSNDADSAIKNYRMASDLKPGDEEPWLHLDSVYRRKGDISSADEAAVKVIEITAQKLEASHQEPLVMSRLAMAYARFNGKEEANTILRKLFESDISDGLVLYYCSCTYSLMGEKSKALMALRTAIESGFGGLANWAKTESSFDSLRKDSTFIELIT